LFNNPFLISLSHLSPLSRVRSQRVKMSAIYIIKLVFISFSNILQYLLVYGLFVLEADDYMMGCSCTGERELKRGVFFEFLLNYDHLV
jgi:hypothetical protein